MNRTPDGKRTRELLRQLPPGVTVCKEGRKAHLSVYGPDGERLRDEKGMPIYVAGTSRVRVSSDVLRIRKALGCE